MVCVPILKTIKIVSNSVNMKPLTVVTSYRPGPFFEGTLSSLLTSGLVEQVSMVAQEQIRLNIPGCSVLIADPFSSGETLNRFLIQIRTEYLLLMPELKQISIEPKALEKLLKTVESTKAGLLYSDFYDESKQKKTLHPLNDYQLGSVRDDFDFGPMSLFSVSPVRKALQKYGAIPEVKFAGHYDLRLKVSIDHSIFHLSEPLYSVIKTEERSSDGRLFAYVDPQQRTLQKEMESVFTDYLKRIGAYLPPDFKGMEKSIESFPVEASVIIPVRNRRETIGEAVQSALSQETDFPFNVIVIDNHSTDGTTAILSDWVQKDSRLIHLIPERTDLGIGGCWNEAIQHHACGGYAVQLDSDDLYRTPKTLQKMVVRLRQEQAAMVIGSYTLVNSMLEEIPPGLVDHREWTEENGHNNALRINGLGAPRGFRTSLLRRIGFPNVSYGEDYAVALKICREHRIGRIYESLYLCRRWSGNTDANLSIQEENQKNAFKDEIRSHEILARQQLVSQKKNRG
jgi:hypothetical protein